MKKGIAGLGKHQASGRGYKHVVNPPAKPSSGKRPKVAPRARSSRNTKADR